MFLAALFFCYVLFFLDLFIAAEEVINYFVVAPVFYCTQFTFFLLSCWFNFTECKTRTDIFALASMRTCTRACMRVGDPEGILLTRLYVEILICALFMDTADESGRTSEASSVAGGAHPHTHYDRSIVMPLTHTHTHTALKVFSCRRDLML